MTQSYSEILKSFGVKKIDSSMYTTPSVANNDVASFNGFDYSNINSMRVGSYPNWFFSARWGQPRQINYLQIRQFARSGWVQTVVKAIKDSIVGLDWDIVNCDKEDKRTYKQFKDKVKLFLNKINMNNDDVEDLVYILINDLCEIDAGSINKIFTADSYEEKIIDLYDDWGKYLGKGKRTVLKPFGQRKLLYLQLVDPATYLKKVDIYKNIQGYFQYSFTNPMGAPKYFEPDELVYLMKNRRSDNVYGFSPVESIQQVLELLMQSTRWNKDYFKNNAIPDGMVGLVGANPDSMKQFKNMWEKEAKGKAHKLLFHNTNVDFQSFTSTAKDMEWLEGQKWYHWLVFAIFGISPVEAGFFQGVNQGNQEGQERISIKNGIKPYYHLIERALNKFIIPEILQIELPPIKFEYQPQDQVSERIEHEQDMGMLDRDVMTINEIRTKKGLKPVEWGDEPMSMYYMQQSEQNNQDNTNDDATLNTEEASEPIPDNPKKFVNKDYINSFRGFMNGRTSKTCE